MIDLVTFVVLVSLLGDCEATIDLSGQQKITFTTPILSEEEEKSPFLPQGFQCDGCKAVSYQLYQKFDEFNRKFKHYKYRLPESEILDLTESVCTTETFKDYGLKEVDGVNRLTGPGLETEDAPGIITGGGLWPRRVLEMCVNFAERVGEENIYDFYRHNTEKPKKLEEFLCYGYGLTGTCRIIKESRNEF